MSDTVTAEIGIFGGTGIYDSGLLDDAQEIKIDTKYGATSDAITVGEFQNRKVAFLPRHGRKHTIPPHMINFRANIEAFRQIGVTQIIAPSAVGSLREELKPGDFVIPSQYIDYTKSREYSFSEIGRVIHISMAEPFCSPLQDVITSVASKLNMTLAVNKTYVCIEGPRFSTKAESKMYRQLGADIIGMTLVPECQLAREAQMCYTSISTVTDYDAWAEKPVTAKDVMETLSKNVERIKKLLTELIPNVPTTRHMCTCASALEDAEF